jgi:hypothetical protein
MLKIEEIKESHKKKNEEKHKLKDKLTEEDKKKLLVLSNTQGNEIKEINDATKKI